MAATATTMELELTTPTPAPVLDLDTLWEMIDRHRLSSERDKLSGEHINTTWELVIVQVSLATGYLELMLPPGVCRGCCSPSYS